MLQYNLETSQGRENLASSNHNASLTPSLQTSRILRCPESVRAWFGGDDGTPCPRSLSRYSACGSVNRIGRSESKTVDFSALAGETTLSGGSGDNIMRGPVHFDLRATTSASNDKSENETLGWDLSSRQALFVGIVSRPDDECGTETEWGSPQYSSRISRVVTSAAGVSSVLQEQSAQGVMLAVASEIAAQNALPNESSAQAIQLAGSPEQLTGAGLGRVDMGKTVFRFDTADRRRSGTGGWYAGRLSRIDICRGEVRWISG